MITITWDYIAGYFDGEGSAGVYDNGKVWHFVFINTHLESLLAIQDFLKAGIIKPRKRIGSSKVCYTLNIQRGDDVRRIVPELITRCMIKRQALQILLNHVKDKKTSPNHGKVEKVGIEEIRRLYWDEGMTLAAIGKKIGVDYRGVQSFMTRHDIPRRPKNYVGANNRQRKHS